MAGTALVFSMSLVMSGLSNAFSVEVDRTLEQSGGDRWVAPSAAAGPFSAGINIPLNGLDAARGEAGVEQADPVLFTTTVADVGGDAIDVTLFGIVPGGLGSPRPTQGRGPARSGEVMVARRLADVGDQMSFYGHSFTVVGTVDKASLIAGTPSAFLILSDAQALVKNGQNVASMIVTRGVPTSLPDGLTAFDLGQARADLSRPLQNATRSIELVRVLLWIVAALIVASVIHLTALERTRDFAIFKATGVPTIAIGAGLALQAVVLALVASTVGAAVALLIAPRFPMDVVISPGSLALLPVFAIAVGLVASLVGLRRIAQVQPAVAFGGP